MKRSYFLAALGVLATLAITSQALGGPSLQSLVRKEVAKQLSTAQTAQLWGYSPERLYAELGRGTLPVEPLALGKRYRWPTLRVAEALSLPVEIVHQDDAAA